MPIEPEKASRKLRLVHGTVQEIEDWINAHWDSYAIQSYTWAVIDGKQMVTVIAILGTEMERLQRLMRLAQGGSQAQFRQ